MIPLPENLKSFEKEARRFRIGDILFADETYQVEVLDPAYKKSVWAFVQLNAKGEIHNAFCSCESDEEVTGCAHIAAAFLRIYAHDKPLHARFEASLWNALGKLFANRLGTRPQTLEQSKDGFQINSAGGKPLFYVKTKTKKVAQFLHEIIYPRKAPTEENSIQFINLPPPEILLWRQGTPSPKLAYALSFWHDLAQYLMLNQDKEEKYKIEFTYDEEEVPKFITIKFPHIEVGFYLSRANLPEIIPSLSTVQSPLFFKDISQQTIKEILYDQKERVLLVHAIEKEKKEELSKQKDQVSINGWTYIKKQGFYSTKKTLFENKVLKGKQIADALDLHPEFMKDHLKNVAIAEDPVDLSYRIFFDPQWSLHIEAYLFQPGDLQLPHSSHLVNNWAYIQDKGFFKIKKGPFDFVTVIPENSVSSFVAKERFALNAYEGFATHLAPVEAQLTYHLSDDNRLSFSKAVDTHSTALSKDFGSWVYIEGRGFYAKMLHESSLPLKEEMTIPEEQIPLFIHNNEEDLRLVPSFFSEMNPMVASWIQVELESQNTIIVKPQYLLAEEYLKKDVRLFGDIVYVKDEGFSFMPASLRLPEPYRSTFYVEKKMFPQFYEQEFYRLQLIGARVHTCLLPPNTLELTIDQIEKGSEPGRYLIKGKYQSEIGTIDLVDFWKGFKKRQWYLFTSAGRLDLTESRFDWLRSIKKEDVDVKKQTLSLHSLDLIRLNALENLQIGPETIGADLFKELNQFYIDHLPDISGLKSPLRPYQQYGLQWLWFLYTHGLSGLLCDDMGLGKTHQAMALIAAMINAHQGKEHPKFLIICPTSVIYHWEDKLKEYFPNLRVKKFYGTDRSIQGFEEYDLLLTSYGIWRNEHKLLSQLSFELTILDEIQIAKNHHSRVHQSLKTIKSKMRVGLTGTPIENHLMELKALFDLTLPGYMPGDKEYREIFVKPIQRDNDPKRKELLTRFIKPFMLRRKKSEVLKDLPEKIEEVSHCELTPEQQTIYHDVLNQSRKMLIEQLRDESSSIPYMHIFAVLSSLKQICNHPAAYLKKPEDYKKYSSGKWELFQELFHEAQDSQQKVVIFSQYLAMLEIFELYLNEQGIKYGMIKGSTKDRGSQIHKFNEDPDCKVFLASLQAAGLGVDLTGGSVVIHYDRWWNAARENQATDRVHRIGQTRGVQVFKLVTKGSFEERIDEMITRKGQLMEEVVGVDDYRFMKAFNREELIELLEDV